MTRNVPITLITGLLTAVLAAGCNGNRAKPVEVMISLDKTATALRSAKVTVDYHQSGATPLMSDGVPACISIVPNVDCAFEDDGAGTLTITAKAQTSFSAPIDLAVCRMVPDAEDTDAAQIASRLRVGLADAIAKDGKPLDKKRLASASGTGRKSPGGGGSNRPQRAAAAPAAGSPDSAAAPEAQKMAKAGGTDVSGLVVNRDDLAAREAQRKADAAASGSAADADRAERIARERAAAQAREANRAAVDDDAALEEADEDGNDPEDSQPVAAYDVVFSVTSDSGLISALQFDVRHLGKSGGWQGAGKDVNCRVLASIDMFACNDTGRGRVRCAGVTISGFPSPTDVLSCVFKTGGTVGAGDFSVQVGDASNPALEPIDVDVRVSSVTPH